MSPIRDRRIKMIMEDKTEVFTETRYMASTVMYHKRRDFRFGHCPQSQAKERISFQTESFSVFRCKGKTQN